ncbi:uncharacterized [Tachysurus ichikawai]
MCENQEKNLSDCERLCSFTGKVADAKPNAVPEHSTSPSSEFQDSESDKSDESVSLSDKIPVLESPYLNPEGEVTEHEAL